MKKLIKKLILSVLLQCALICGYLSFILLFKESGLYGWLEWLVKIVLLITFIIIQVIVYRIYKKSPLESDIHKGIYLIINGIFIVLETEFLAGVFG